MYLGIGDGYMCCPHFYTPLLHKAATNDLLFTLLPLLCRLSSHNSLGVGGLRESLRAPSDDQQVLERSWQPIICLLVAGVLLGFTFQDGAISYIPAWRAVSYLEWTGGFSLPWHATECDSDRFVLCLLRENLQSFVSSHLCMFKCKRKCSPGFQNQDRLVTQEAFLVTPPPPPPPIRPIHQCKEESFPLKCSQTQLSKCGKNTLGELMWFWLSRLEMSFMVTFQY